MSFSIHLSAMKHTPFVDMVPIDMIPANYLSLVEDIISQRCFFVSTVALRHSQGNSYRSTIMLSSPGPRVVFLP